jgi:hypothetical protein
MWKQFMLVDMKIFNLLMNTIQQTLIQLQIWLVIE